MSSLVFTSINVHIPPLLASGLETVRRLALQGKLPTRAIIATLGISRLASSLQHCQAVAVGVKIKVHPSFFPFFWAVKFSGSSAQPTFRKRNIARAQQFTKGCYSERGLSPVRNLSGFAIGDVGGTDTAVGRSRLTLL